jgi:hypothetical protein
MHWSALQNKHVASWWFCSTKWGVLVKAHTGEAIIIKKKTANEAGL